MLKYFLIAVASITIGVFAYQFFNKKEQPIVIISTSDSTSHLPVFASQAPALLVKKNQNDSVSYPLEIRKVKLDTKIIGNIATTKIEITFYNDLERVLDGEFCFPLGESQSVSYFAQETDAVLMEASVVEKSKGRTVYESIVRRRVDPALLEWTAGNNFRTRIYPIPARGVKKIIIGFEQELIKTEKSYLYYQPFSFKEKIDELSIHAEVFKQEVKPDLYDDGPVTIEFEKWKENWIADKILTNYLPNKPLAFEIPFAQGAKQVFTEKYSI